MSKSNFQKPVPHILRVHSAIGLPIEPEAHSASEVIVEMLVPPCVFHDMRQLPDVMSIPYIGERDDWALSLPVFVGSTTAVLLVIDIGNLGTLEGMSELDFPRPIRIRLRPHNGLDFIDIHAGEVLRQTFCSTAQYRPLEAGAFAYAADEAVSFVSDTGYLEQRGIDRSKLQRICVAYIGPCMSQEEV